MKHGDFFRSLFLGPVLANIEKSIKGAQSNSLVTKRKHRDEAPKLSDEAEFPEFCRQQENGGGIARTGVVQKGRLEGEETELSNDSGMAVTSF
jgi:hypothetical protein